MRAFTRSPILWKSWATCWPIVGPPASVCDYYALVCNVWSVKRSEILCFAHRTHICTRYHANKLKVYSGYVPGYIAYRIDFRRTCIPGSCFSAFLLLSLFSFLFFFFHVGLNCKQYEQDAYCVDSNQQEYWPTRWSSYNTTGITRADLADIKPPSGCCR